MRAAVAALGFFCFIFVLGYAWPTASAMEDFLKNRAFTLVMAALMVPVLWERLSDRKPMGHDASGVGA